ncbi:MAG: OmpA family protein [Planctomycetes bacterium]|nr:OmpA family protein [Planctomycetota bacterium]
MSFRTVFLLTMAAIAAGCYSNEQYAALLDSQARASNRNREYLKAMANLELKMNRLEQEKAALKLEIARRDERLTTYRSHLEWTRLIPGAEVSSEGNLILKGDVIFQPGSHKLTDQGRQTLEDLANVLGSERRNIAGIRIDGHTDSAPINKTKDKYDSNMHLSFMRAYFVYNYLCENSRLEPAKLYIAAFGEHRPRSEDPAENRRVEILVLPNE